MVHNDGKNLGLLLLFVRLAASKYVFLRPRTGFEKLNINKTTSFLWSLVTVKSQVCSSYMSAWFRVSAYFLGPRQALKMQKSLKILGLTRI